MKPFVHLLLLITVPLLFTVSAEEIALIPRPQSLLALPGVFELNEHTAFKSDTAMADDAIDYLQSHLERNAHYRLKHTHTSSHLLNYRHVDGLVTEGYLLEVTPQEIVLQASEPAGFFYATVTLMQLMETAIWREGVEKEPHSIWHIPACKVSDQPRFRWRGMMLDSARNFFSVAYVKKFIDRMAQHKLNLFHWHLSDDEGWRIEIKKYPRLTAVGARRGPGTKLPFTCYPAMRGPKTEVQEGFYTQAQVREIVAYAARRSVRVLPEIDMPAHAKATIVSYPELLLDPQDSSDYRSIQKVHENTMDPGLESTYAFIDGVIEELVTIFPFGYIHLGGDEVPKGAWKGSPAVAALMNKEHLTDNRAVQAYFFERVDRILQKYHRTLVAWQEIRRDNTTLRKETIIMAWRGDGTGLKAAKAGQPVVMTPAQFLYFDQQYVASEREHGHTWAGPTDTKEVYSYEPLHDSLTSIQRDAIQGVEGALWSERAPTEAIADYLAWPRMLALSEVAWSRPERRVWHEFRSRALTKGLQRLKEQGVHYREPTTLP